MRQTTGGPENTRVSETEQTGLAAAAPPPAAWAACTAARRIADTGMRAGLSPRMVRRTTAAKGCVRTRTETRKQEVMRRDHERRSGFERREDRSGGVMRGVVGEAAHVLAEGRRGGRRRRGGARGWRRARAGRRVRERRRGRWRARRRRGRRARGRLEGRERGAERVARGHRGRQRRRHRRLRRQRGRRPRRGRRWGRRRQRGRARRLRRRAGRRGRRRDWRRKRGRAGRRAWRRRHWRRRAQRRHVAEHSHLAQPQRKRAVKLAERRRRQLQRQVALQRAPGPRCPQRLPAAPAAPDRVTFRQKGLDRADAGVQLNRHVAAPHARGGSRGGGGCAATEGRWVATHRVEVPTWVGDIRKHLGRGSQQKTAMPPVRESCMADTDCPSCCAVGRHSKGVVVSAPGCP